MISPSFAGRCGLCLLLLFSFRGFSQPPSAPIPDSLSRDAVMVVRENQLDIEIISPRKAKLHRRYVYTILNSRGDGYAPVHAFYDKFNDLVSVTATLYDAGGHPLKKIRKSDMEDWNTGGNGILMSDTRLKYYPFTCRNYPYTVSFEEESELSGFFMLPEWQPQPARNIAVEDCRLVVRTPAGYPLRYKSYRYSGEPQIADEKGGKQYVWEIKDRPAVQEEGYAPAWYYLSTLVRLAPGDFELEGYKGSLYTWADLGKFVNALYQGRDQLPEEAKQKVHQLVDGLSDDRQKIAVLYRFLQQNTHYIGIELGIGGWQPFDPNYVYTKRYGDCKALANYMVALLKEAGIRGSSVLIRGGAGPALDTAFVCSQFNHAIAVAFTGADSVWLECTSSLLAPGYLGSFTSDKDALLIDPAGGSHIIHTPVYGLKENRFSRGVNGTINTEGDLEASLVYSYSGLEQDAVQSKIDQLQKRDLIKDRQESFGIPNAKLSSWSYATDSSAAPAGLSASPASSSANPARSSYIPSLRETMSLSAPQFATVTGNRLIFVPGYFFHHSIGLKEEPHSSSFELGTSFEETDSVVLRLPPGYQPEGTGMSASYTSPCGRYSIHSTYVDGVFTLICHLQEYKGVYEAAVWPRLVRLFNLMHREAARQLIFVKQ